MPNQKKVNKGTITEVSFTLELVKPENLWLRSINKEECQRVKAEAALGLQVRIWAGVQVLAVHHGTTLKKALQAACGHQDII